jgi:hypothetical protein
MARAPTGFGHALGALDLYLSQAREVAVVGDLEADATRSLLREVWGSFRPNVVLAAADPSNAEAGEIVPLLAGKSTLNGSPAAYVCERFACKQPVSEPEALTAQLD